MVLRDRLPIQTEPEHVERAPRWERWKRNAWMIGSTLLVYGTVLGLLSALIEAISVPSGAGRLVLLAFAIGVFVATLIHKPLFRWGFRRFDLTYPWQFREAAGYTDEAE